MTPSEPLSQVGRSCDSDKIQFMTLLSHYLRLDSHVIQTRSSSWPFWAIISGWKVMWFRQDPVHDPSEPLSQVGQSCDSDKIQFMTPSEPLSQVGQSCDSDKIQFMTPSEPLSQVGQSCDSDKIQFMTPSEPLSQVGQSCDSDKIQFMTLLSHYLRLDSHVIQTRSSSWPFWAIISGWTVIWFRQDPVHDPSEPLSQVGQSCDSDKIQFMTLLSHYLRLDSHVIQTRSSSWLLLSHYLRLDGHVIQTRSSSWPFWAIISGWTVMWFRQDPVHDSFWAIISGWTVMWFRQDPVHDPSEPLAQVGRSCDSDKIQFITLLSH